MHRKIISDSNPVSLKRQINQQYQIKSKKKQLRAFINKQPQSLKQISNRQIKFPKVNTKNLPYPQINYILKQIIGQGAYATVRQAYCKNDSFQCVIKTYEKYRMNSQQKKKLIFKQIQILKNINHPNIIKILDSYETPTTFNIVMQNFSSMSLSSWSKRQSHPINQDTIKQITKQIASGLVYLHSNKISHRDIKPENILINQLNKIKIIDLGLSMMGQHTQMIVAGTPQFMCPQLINKKKYDPYKADIWAFGILLYYIVLGYYPQDNCNIKKNVKNDKKNSFLLKFPIDMHPGIQYLIEKMLQTDPDLRIQADQILQDSWLKPKNLKFQISKLSKIVST